ncbi:galactose-1-phosphate uridylyltransferase [Nesterenkonia sp. NBAIMH1]|uniref:galactose-1-phosphate uridylyltransferase n=2 Tax=Nesterenkonia TaxID=57494 RepID=UPI001AEFE291|nr:galactose-1-phosphate uridylyltransferase [Nesterenkonia sp. NBAIMH1]
MNRTTAQLADGRDIFFYDDETRTRSVHDGRDIARPEGANEMRFDPLLGEWTAVAAARQNRTHKPSADACPLCPSTPERATEVPEAEFDVVVFENRFPSFRGEAPVPPDVLEHLEPAEEAGGLVRPGAGRCEVVVFTDQHTGQLAEVPAARMRTVVDAWADRTEALMREPGVEQVYIFENRGEEIGVTLHHPHGQIYGYPFRTPRTQKIMAQADGFRRRHGKDLFDEILSAEPPQGSPVILAGERWTAMVPPWARWPVEIMILPHRSVGRLHELTEAERTEFAAMYLEVLRRGDQLFDGPLPYISGWQQAPRGATGEDMRLHLQLFSIRRASNKLKYLAGSESGMGVFINDIAPEDMAARLRDAGDDA